MARLPLDAEIRAKDIVEKFGGIWRGTRGECRCPAHDDSSPSLSVRLGDTAILFHCFAGCTTTEVLKALQRRRLHDRGSLSMPEAKHKRDMGALALRLWNASVAVDGTLAEEYLLARGLSGPFPKSLRFNPATIHGSGPTRRTMPAMIAAVENDLGVMAVQRTFLDPENVLHKPLPKPKVSLGLLGTGAIRLAPATDELGFAEGNEDALSVMKWFGTPTWGLGGVERLAFVAIPDKVRRIIVYGDRGRAADRLLAKARDHLTANGRELVNRVPEHHETGMMRGEPTFPARRYKELNYEPASSDLLGTSRGLRCTAVESSAQQRGWASIDWPVEPVRNGVDSIGRNLGADRDAPVRRDAGVSDGASPGCIGISGQKLQRSCKVAGQGVHAV